MKGKLIVVVITVILIAIWVGRHQLLTAAARWLDIGTPPQATDYVYVLNGDVNSRPFVAAAVVNAGYASKVLLVPMDERPKRPSDPTPPIHEILRQVLIHRGVAPQSIEIIDGLVASTFDEAESLREYLGKTNQQDATVAIVTSNFHTRRTRWIFRRALDDGHEHLSFVSAPTHGYDATNWWRVEDGFTTYTTEYLKFAFYVFRYGNGWRIIAVAGAVMLVLLAIAMRRSSRRGALANAT